MTTTEDEMAKIPPVHPGEILMEDFIRGFEITQHKLAVSIGVPPRRINEIVHGKRASPLIPLCAWGKYFGTSAQFWLNLLGPLRPSILLRIVWRSKSRPSCLFMPRESV